MSSQLSLQTEKSQTPWEVIFQSTKTEALEISADAKMLPKIEDNFRGAGLEITAGIGEQ